MHSSIIFKNNNTDVITSYINRIGEVGSISKSHIEANTKLYESLISNNLWDKVLDLWTCSGNTLKSCLVKLKYTENSYSSQNNINFIESDYNINFGLKGDGLTKYLKTGFIPNKELKLLSDFHIFFYDTNTYTDTLIRRTFGSTFISRTLDYYTDANLRGNFLGNVASTINNENSIILQLNMLNNPPGRVFINSNSSGCYLYNNGTLLGTDNIYVNSNNLPPVEFYLFNRNNNDATTTGSPARLSLFAVGYGLTSIEEQTYDSIIAQFISDLGR